MENQSNSNDDKVFSKFVSSQSTKPKYTYGKSRVQKQTGSRNNMMRSSSADSFGARRSKTNENDNENQSSSGKNTKLQAIHPNRSAFQDVSNTTRKSQSSSSKHRRAVSSLETIAEESDEAEDVPEDVYDPRSLILSPINGPPKVIQKSIGTVSPLTTSTKKRKDAEAEVVDEEVEGEDFGDENETQPKAKKVKEIQDLQDCFSTEEMDESLDLINRPLSSRKVTDSDEEDEVVQEQLIPEPIAESSPVLVPAENEENDDPKIPFLPVSETTSIQLPIEPQNSRDHIDDDNNDLPTDDELTSDSSGSQKPSKPQKILTPTTASNENDDYATDEELTSSNSSNASPPRKKRLTPQNKFAIQDSDSEQVDGHDNDEESSGDDDYENYKENRAKLPPLVDNGTMDIFFSEDARFAHMGKVPAFVKILQKRKRARSGSSASGAV
ncbi:hypothetical protein HK098_008387 [Nowakowskiella sp. JEL0407]|nr:hypothetical protein HK098_008377 [Nowakowskiella sp. JEL0407]KAJ3125598.1 hypothetical protein HK098_008387 [Nowakowskiella sp. JEL0407]